MLLQIIYHDQMIYPLSHILEAPMKQGYKQQFHQELCIQ